MITYDGVCTLRNAAFSAPSDYNDNVSYTCFGPANAYGEPASQPGLPAGGPSHACMRTHDAIKPLRLNVMMCAPGGFRGTQALTGS